MGNTKVTSNIGYSGHTPDGFIFDVGYNYLITHMRLYQSEYFFRAL